MRGESTVPLGAPMLLVTTVNKQSPMQTNWGLSVRLSPIHVTRWGSTAIVVSLSWNSQGWIKSKTLAKSVRCEIHCGAASFLVNLL